MTLSLRCFAAASQTGYNLPDHQGTEDEDAPEDLQRHQPVPRKPVAEDGGEDRLHRKDYRRPGGGDVQHRRWARRTTLALHYPSVVNRSIATYETQAGCIVCLTTPASLAFSSCAESSRS